jgi:hypothetical protein
MGNRGTPTLGRHTMTEQKPQDEPREKQKREPRDAAYWAKYAETLKVAGVADGATNINVDGRRAVGPLQGFGKMWQKTYRVGLAGAEVSPVEVIKTWKDNYQEFWPEGNRFYAPLAGIAPGEVALISGSLPGGVKLSTGVMVLYADDESFSLMTPEGHPFSGWITFSSFEEAGTTVAQAQVLMRANDPLYEMGLRMGGHKVEKDPREPGSPLRRSRAGRDERGLRRPEAPVEPVSQHLA